MRIGIVISHYRRYGGLERVSGEWARGLAERGHDVVAFCQTFEPGAGDELIEIVPVGGMHSPAPARAATFPPAATRAVRVHPCDVVVSFGYGVLDPCVLRLPGAHRPWWEIAARIDPLTSVAGVRRRINPHHQIILALERRMLGGGLAQAVLAAAEGAAADIKRLYPRVAPVVDVVPDGIDLNAFAFTQGGRTAMRRAWNAEDAYVVLTVATEVRRKGIEGLVSAFARFARERADAVLVVAGTAPPPEIAQAATRAGIASRVRVAGFVDDIAAAYSAADLFVLPTLYDHWGLPIVEALACGTPVASAASAGASQAVDDGRTGVLVGDVLDEAALAGAIARAAALETPREECRAAAEPYAWVHVVDLAEKKLIAIAERSL